MRSKLATLAMVAGMTLLALSTFSLKPKDVRPGSVILLQEEPLVQYRVIRWNSDGWEVIPEVGPGEHKVIRPDDVFSIVRK